MCQQVGTPAQVRFPRWIPSGSDPEVIALSGRREARLPLTNEENGLVLRRYWTNACQSCAIKQRCTTGKERQITRWEHEHVLEAVQKRLDRNPQAMRQRRKTAARDGRSLYSRSPRPIQPACP